MSRRLAVLAEIGGPSSSNGRTWGLRRHDLEALGGVRERLGARKVVLITGAEEAAPTVALALAAVAAAAGVATAVIECDVERPRRPAAPAVALALAAVAAAAGVATAVIECDVERPRLAADLGLAPTPGLHEYLRWE